MPSKKRPIKKIKTSGFRALKKKIIVKAPRAETPATGADAAIELPDNQETLAPESTTASSSSSTPSNSTSMEPFIGQIIMFGGNFAPRGWAKCDGQLLPISTNTALFSILGTTYGGDGRTTFALPDLRGKAPMHAGHGPGLSDRRLGSKGGSESNTLNITQLPSHSHSVSLTKAQEGLASSAQNAVEAGNAASNSANIEFVSENTGGNQPVNNMQPYLAINYIIALIGIFPSRS